METFQIKPIRIIRRVIKKERMYLKSLLVPFLFFLVTFTQNANCHNCSTGFFNCGNGKCIAKFFLCDDDNDCGNNHDELDCDAKTSSQVKDPNNHSNSDVSSCPSNEFDCHDAQGNCLPQRWVCDGVAECQNGLDEHDCLKQIECGKDFRCDSKCIPYTWRCDGVNDCDDQTDEKDCTKYKEQEFCDKVHHKFQCKSGLCIDYDNVCDGKKNCPSGDDEGEICLSTKCQDKKCSHKCRMDEKTKKPICYCPPGYTLLHEEKCIDYDECSDNKMANLCSQKCINTEGSYECACNDGYYIYNKTGCLASGISPFLFFSAGQYVNAYSIRGNTLFPVIYANDVSETILSVDISVKNQKFYFSVITKDSYSSVYEVSFIPSKPNMINSAKRLIFRDISSQIEGISVDWLANHVYLASYKKNRIIVCNTETLICATLIDNLHHPRGILVLPTRGKLFWTQWGDDHGIFEAWMDGSERFNLFSDVGWPNDLTYDEEKNRLYWCDGKWGKIEYFDFDTEIRTTIYEDVRQQPFSLFVFEDYLYWSDWTGKELISCEKNHCHHQKVIYQPGANHARNIFGVTMYHPVIQKESKFALNPCKDHPCSHLCLIKYNDSFSCSCPDHTFLGQNNRTCVNKADNPFVIVSAATKLYKFYNTLSNVFEEIPFSPMFAINDLTYNPKNEEIFFYDSFKARIVMTNLAHNSINRRFKILASEDILSVFGLSYDINTDNVYWVDMLRGTLEVVNIKNTFRAVLRYHLNSPISLAISPSFKTFYIGLKTKHTEILALSMDGLLQRTILKAELGLPMAMTSYSNGNYLLWADPIIQRIDFLNLYQNKLEAHKLVEKHVGTVQSIAATNGTIYWTNADSPNLYFARLYPGPVLQLNGGNGWARLPEQLFDFDMLRVISTEPQPQHYSYCIKNGKKNNPCEHICLIGKSGYTCKCAIGYSTKNNGLNCYKDSNETSLPIALELPPVFSLDRLFSFILSKQKDDAPDTWVADNGSSNSNLDSNQLITSSTNSSMTTSQTDEVEEEMVEVKTDQNQQESSISLANRIDEDDEEQKSWISKRNIIILWLVLLVTIVIAIVLCIRLQALQNQNIQSMVDFIRQNITSLSNKNNSNRSGNFADREGLVEDRKSLNYQEAKQNQKQLKNKQVRFFTNPNYNLSLSDSTQNSEMDACINVNL